MSQEEKRIGLSIRKMEEKPKRDTYKGYMNQQKKATSNLGELLREKMIHSQAEPSLDSQESEVLEAAETESDAQSGATDTEP